MNKPGEKRIETFETELTGKELDQVIGGGNSQRYFEYGGLAPLESKKQLPAVQNKLTNRA